MKGKAMGMGDIVCLQHLKYHEIWYCFRKKNSETDNQVPNRYLGLTEVNLMIDRDTTHPLTEKHL